MMRLSRPLGLFAATSALVVPTVAAPQGSDIQQAFAEGRRALEQNDQEAAARAFQRVLAADPSNDQAYELWRSIEDQQVWTELLMAGGQVELATQRILELARAGRQEHRNDPAAIREALTRLVAAAADPIERREITANLAAHHGEYVVPLMIPALADPSGGERGVLFMNSLTQMGPTVVLPLIAALESSSSQLSVLRRNVAIVLGRIGDRRALGSLLALVDSNSDSAVTDAALQALEKIQGAGNVQRGTAVATLVAEGRAYAFEQQEVLAPYGYSDTTWRFDGQALIAVPTHPAFYALENGKRRFLAALRLDPSSAEARAGLALVGSKGQIKAAAVTAAGGDVGEMESRVQHGHLAALVAGPEALDGALQLALQQGDEAATVGLLRDLATLGQAVGTGVRQALTAEALRVRGEAAVAVAEAGLAGDGSAPLSEAVEVLGDCAELQVLRQVLVIDSDAGRNAAFAQAIDGLEGFRAVPATNGVQGLRLVLDVERADAILLATELSDLTADALLEQIGRRPELESAPVLLLAPAGDEVAEAYGDRVAGVLSSPGEVATTLVDAVGETLSAGQDLANHLAGRAAGALARLAQSGHADVVAPAAPALALAAARPLDSVSIPALGALGQVGDDSGAAVAAAVAADGGRSDEARVAAAQALTAMLRRGVSVSADDSAALIATLQSDASAAVRAAVAGALGLVGDGGNAGGRLAILESLDPIASE
jgi:hypothetical protein